MIRRKIANPRHPTRQAPENAASDAGALLNRGIDLERTRDDVTKNPDRADDLPLGPLLTVRDVTSLLRVSRATVYNWVNSEQIPYFRINSVVRFSLNRLEAWLIECERGSLPPLANLENGEDETPRPPGLESVRTDVGRNRRGRTSRGQMARQARDDDQSRLRAKTKWLIDLDSIR